MIENLSDVTKIACFQNISACIVNRKTLYHWGEFDGSSSELPIQVPFVQDKSLPHLINEIQDFKLGSKLYIILNTNGNVFTIDTKTNTVNHLKKKVSLIASGEYSGSFVTSNSFSFKSSIFLFNLLFIHLLSENSIYLWGRVPTLDGERSFEKPTKIASLQQIGTVVDITIGKLNILILSENGRVFSYKGLTFPFISSQTLWKQFPITIAESGNEKNKFTFNQVKFVERLKIGKKNTFKNMGSLQLMQTKNVTSDSDIVEASIKSISSFEDQMLAVSNKGTGK